MQAEFKKSESDLATTYAMLCNEILKIKEQISEIKNIPNVTQAVLKEYAETRDKITALQLSDIQGVVNDKMKEITVEIVCKKDLIPLFRLLCTMQI